MIQFFSSCTLQHDSTQMNGSVSWNRILVFAFLNFRISTITGLEQLTELKVLNLAGNLIRKVTGVQNLGCVEELNLRCRWKHNHRKKNSLHLKKCPGGTGYGRRRACSRCPACRSCTWPTIYHHDHHFHRHDDHHDH